MFDAIVKMRGSEFITEGFCNRESGVTDRLEFGLCQALYYTEVPPPLYTSSVSQPVGMGGGCGSALGV